MLNQLDGKRGTSCSAVDDDDDDDEDGDGEFRVRLGIVITPLSLHFGK